MQGVAKWQTMIVFVMLLMLRSLGYRLVREPAGIIQ
jgi:hypothetical protein